MFANPSSTNGQPETLIDLLARRVADAPEQTAFVYVDEDDSEQRWTYADLGRRTAAAAATIAAASSPGDRAVLAYPPGLDFIAAFLGCMQAGVLPTPATYPKPRRPLPRLDAIARDCSPNLALTTQQALEKIQIDQQSTAVQALQWIATDGLPAHDAPVVAPQRQPDQPAFLQYTSGSTSDPRGVIVTHGNLLHNLELIRQGFDIPQPASQKTPASGVFWLPAYHDMGLIGGVLTPIYVGGASYLIAPTAFLRRPLIWLEWLSRTGAAISGAPNFAYDLCVDKSNPEQRAQLDLSRWELAFCGAEPVREATLRRFADAFAPANFRPEAFYPCYGLAEATLMVSGGKRSAPLRTLSLDRDALAENRIVEDAAVDAKTMVGCGAGLGEQEVRIVNHQTRQLCSDRTVGEIWVRGRSIAQGYWRPNGDESFNASLACGDGGFLRTGDLGFLDQGELFVTGRLKDVIIIRGRNHYPQDIERTVQQAHPAADFGAAFGVTEGPEERLVIVHQIDRQHRRADLEQVLMAIRTAVVEQHELDPSAIVLIKPASLPVTSSGKVQRSRCRAMFLEDNLKVLAQWRHEADASDPSDAEQPRPDFLDRLGELNLDQTTAAVCEWMLAWIANRLALSARQLSAEVPFAELGVDSMTSVELALEFEEVLGVRLTPEVAWSYPTPAELSRHLAERLKEVDAPVQ